MSATSVQGWLVLCEAVVQDKATEALTLVSCLDQVATTGFPGLHPRFAFAATLWRTSAAEDDLPLELRFMRISEGEEQVTWRVDGSWPSNVKRLRAFHAFSGVRLERPGPLSFRLDWRLGGGAWEQGPTAMLEVTRLRVTRAMVEQLQSQGTPEDVLDKLVVDEE